MPLTDSLTRSAIAQQLLLTARTFLMVSAEERQHLITTQKGRDLMILLARALQETFDPRPAHLL